MYLYFWPAAINGDIAAYDRSAHANVPFAKIFHNLKFGATGAIKVSKNDWFAFYDALYMRITPGVTAVLPEGISVNANLDSRIFASLLAAGYQWETPVQLNVFAGVRYFYGKVSLNALEAAGPYSQQVDVAQSKNWFVPTIGGEIKLPIMNKLYFDLYGNIGAVVRSTNWELLPSLFWDINRTLSIAAGYRMQDVYHYSDGFKLRTLLHGPVIGAKLSF